MPAVRRDGDRAGVSAVSPRTKRTLYRVWGLDRMIGALGEWEWFHLELLATGIDDAEKQAIEKRHASGREHVRLDRVVEIRTGATVRRHVRVPAQGGRPR